MAKLLIILSTLAVCSLAQRPSYLRRPIGYPEIEPTTRPPSTTPRLQSTDNPTGNRLNGVEGRTYVPTEFQSDPISYYYYMRLPMNQRPFNVINARQIQDWNSEPHTYSLKHNNYATH